jgi:divalent metal cation (Fe/Co/Zn/Cd) transporter
LSSESLAFRGSEGQAKLLVGASLLYNSIELVVALAVGAIAGSIALIGFGFDSGIEVSASAVVMVHLLKRDQNGEPAWEHRVAIFVGITFMALAAYVGFEAVRSLVQSKAPDETYFGIGLAAVSLAVMPALSSAKHRLAHQINSRALEAESRETLICSYLSAALLLGLAANAAFGWWWADPAAALVIVAVLGKEGWEAFTRKELCCLD